MNYLKIILATFIVILTFGCSLQKQPSKEKTATTQTANDFTNQDPKLVNSQTQTDLTKAKEAAKSWQDNAQFYGLNFPVPQDLNPKGLTKTFVFGSDKQSEYWFTYSIDTDGKSVRALVFKDDFFGKDLQPIQESFWKKTYSEALKAADDNGGFEYKAQHPEAEITVTLQQSQPNNWLWYIVDYRSATDNKKVRINANDGKIYDEQGNLLSGQTSSTNTNQQ